MTIEQIQHLLAYLGYYAIRVDGAWGPASEAACRAFQKDFGLAVDGIPGVETQKALGHAVSFGMPEGEEQEKPADEDAAFWAGIRYFSKSEFTCHCGCGLNNVDHRLVLICEDIREKAGVPFLPSSGCRCKKKNDSLPGSAPNSRHLYGRAVDFALKGKTADQTMSIIGNDKRIAYKYKIDGDYVHIDIV